MASCRISSLADDVESRACCSHPKIKSYLPPWGVCSLDWMREMRRALGWVSIVVFSCGCSSDYLPLSPTESVTSGQSGGSGRSSLSLEPAGGWLPWYWRDWQPGIGERLVPGGTVDTIVEANDVCVSNLRTVWDARSSCRRFVVSVSSPGRLDASLLWDPAAPGFDLSLAGEVVLVAPSGRFASSNWQQVDPQVFALVEPGSYGLLVISYVATSLPFQLTTALSSSGSQ